MSHISGLTLFQIGLGTPASNNFVCWIFFLVGQKEKIENLLKQELKEDRAKTQVEGFTKLDLMELTRKHICSHKG